MHTSPGAEATKPRNHRAPSLRINAVSSWASLGANIIVGLSLTPVVISYLGKTHYGIWTLVGSFIGYYGLLNCGIGSAIIRYVARYAAARDDRSLNETVSTAFSMFTCTGVLAVVLSFLCAGPLAGFFRVSPEHTEDFKHVIWIIGFSTGVSFPGSIFGGVVTAYEKFIAVNFCNIGSTCIRAILTVLFLRQGFGLPGMAWALFISTLMGIGANAFLFRVYAPEIRIRFSLARKKILRQLLLYGGATTVIVIGDLIRSNLDSFVVAKWVGITEVGVYGIALLMVRYIVRLVATGMGVLTPRFAGLDGMGDRAKLQELFKQTLAVSSLLAFGGGALVFLFGGKFIALWVGEGFSESAIILQILVISSAFAVAQNPSIGLLYALNKHHYYAAATIIEAVGNLLLSIFLASRYGMVGVALGTLIPMMLIKVFVMPVYVSRIVGIEVLSYLRPMLAPALVASGMCLLVHSLVPMARYLSGLIQLIVAGGITGGLYLTACYLTMNKHDRVLVVSLMPKGRAFGLKAKSA
jgi:O-antigen/teichoic acid export membrane protein